MTGVDVPIPDLQTAIHQPTILEISYIGELDYFSTLQMFCFNRNTLLAAEGNSHLSQMSNFQIFMTLMTDPSIENRDQRINNMLSVLTILFPGYTAQLLPRSLYFNNTTTKHNFTLDETNFDSFRDLLTEVAGVNNSTGGQNSNFNPKGKRAAEIAAKLMRGRAKAASDKGQSIDGVLARYVSILTVGLPSMSLKECLGLTVYQLYDLIERYGLHTGWDLDIRSRLAGGKPDDKPDDWMKDIH